MFNYFLSEKDGAYILKAPGYFVLILLLLAFLFAASALSRKGEKKHFSTKQLVFCAVSIALAMITSYLKLYSFPFGGSVTLFSMFFICLAGYLYGPSVGIMTGMAYGILQFIIEPFILFPLQVLVDYPLAFGALGLSGFFWNSRNGLIKGYLAGILGRYFFGVISGWIFFGQYAWEGWSPLAYSLTYNGCYIFTEAIITIILLCIPVLKHDLAQVKNMAVPGKYPKIWYN